MRRSILLAGGIGLLVANPPSLGQATSGIRRIGWLSIGSKDSPAEGYAAFKQGMRELGWREGKNVEYQDAYAEGNVDRLEALVGELVARKVEMIVVGNPTSTRAAQRITKTIPILMVSIANPVGNGFVETLARPGGNITGISNRNEELLGKLIEMLHEMAPEAQRIAIVLNESNPNHSVLWSAAQRACSSLKLVALRNVASGPAQFNATVDQIVRQRSQAIVVVADPVYLNERAKLQASLQTTHLPVAFGFREHVIAGGLLSYSANLSASLHYAATYADKILKGARPADLPVEQATKFELVINLTTARTLGLTIPRSLLLRTDEIIQ